MNKIVRRIRDLKSRQSWTGGQEIEVYDVTSFATEIDLETLNVIRWAPVWMSRAERLLLYTLIFALRPSRYLEIGTFQGGSALVAKTAMDASSSTGKIICIDPQPQIDPEHWQQLESRTTLLTGYSPAILPQAQAVAGGPFDFVLIDGDHTYDGVRRDAQGILPHLTDNAYLLFHDSLFADVARGLDDFARENADHVVDCGTLTREVTYQARPDGEAVRWGGLRLMQKRRDNRVI